MTSHSADEMNLSPPYLGRPANTIELPSNGPSPGSAVPAEELISLSELARGMAFAIEAEHVQQAEAIRRMYNDAITLAAGLVPIIVQACNKWLYTGCPCAATSHMERIHTNLIEIDDLVAQLLEDYNDLKEQIREMARELQDHMTAKESVLKQLINLEIVLSVRLRMMHKLADRQCDLDDGIDISMQALRPRVEVASTIILHDLSIEEEKIQHMWNVKEQLAARESKLNQSIHEGETKRAFFRTYAKTVRALIRDMKAPIDEVGACIQQCDKFAQKKWVQLQSEELTRAKTDGFLDMCSICHAPKYRGSIRFVDYCRPEGIDDGDLRYLGC